MNYPPDQGKENVQDYMNMQLAYGSNHQGMNGQTEHCLDEGFQPLVDEICKSIKGEAEAINFYTRLLKIAPNKKHREDIKHALNDERIHLRYFTGLYRQLTGAQPFYKTEKARFSNYYDGLKKAFYDEIEAYEMYRDIYLMTNDPMIRDIYLKAFTDEMEHASRFSFLYLENR